MSEKEACHYWTDPETGKRHFIPMCYGRIHGPAGACTCPSEARRRDRDIHKDPLAADYARLARECDRLREDNATLRSLLKEARDGFRSMIQKGE